MGTERAFCLSMTAGNVAADFLQIVRGSYCLGVDEAWKTF